MTNKGVNWNGECNNDLSLHCEGFNEGDTCCRCGNADLCQGKGKPTMTNPARKSEGSEMPDKVFVYNDCFGLRLNEEPSVEADIFKTTTYTRTPPQPDQPSDESRARALEMLEHAKFMIQVGEAKLFVSCKDILRDGYEATRSALTAQKPETGSPPVEPSAAVDLEALKLAIKNHPYARGRISLGSALWAIDYLAAQGYLTQPRGGE